MVEKVHDPIEVGRHVHCGGTRFAHTAIGARLVASQCCFEARAVREATEVNAESERDVRRLAKPDRPGALLKARYRGGV